MVEIFSDKLSDKIGVNFISFSISEGDRFRELFNKLRIDKADIFFKSKDKTQEVNVVYSSRFKSDDRIIELMNDIFEVVKTVIIHMKFFLRNDVEILVNNRIMKRIFRNINADEVRKLFFVHFVNLRMLLLKLVPKSNLPVNSGFKAKSTDRDLGDRGQTPLEALKLRNYEVFCPRNLFKLIISELNFCKYLFSINLYHKKT